MSIEDNLARLADAAEIIAAHLTGADAPRVPSTKDTSAEDTSTKEQTATAKKAADKAAKDKAAKDKAAKDKAAEAAKEADDPFADTGRKDKIEEADVREVLSKLIEQDGKAAAFEVMRDKGGGAKNFSELKSEHYEDVYVEAKERLG